MARQYGCPDCDRSTSGNCGEHNPWKVAMGANDAIKQPAPKGWECPKCGTANAPWMPTCGGCPRG